MYDSDDSSSGSEYDDNCDFCSMGAGCAFNPRNGVDLPFDPTALQNIILKLGDLFDIRIIMNDRRTHRAIAVGGALAIAGTMIGKHYGGNVGAMFGGAVGGACGVGIAMVSLREVWEDIKSRLWALYEIAYDYLAGMGLRDYKTAVDLLLRDGSGGAGAHLAQILAGVASDLLKKKITTSITL